MFKVQIDEDEYEVTFRHSPRERGTYYPGTDCKIQNINSDGWVRWGATSLHPKDNYCRNTGRKMSLARAMREGKFTKDDRKLFWDKYFEVRGKVN